MTPLPPPIVHPSRCGLPVLLSVPHSGRVYPDWLVGLSSRGCDALSALEDPLVDLLAARAVERGFGAVVAQAPRAAVDCNRAETDIDPAVVRGGPPGRVSARARGGLGIVPGRTQRHGSLWRRQLSTHELDQRLEQAHRPYHQAIERQLEAIVTRFGCAILLDCHSMPPPPQRVAQVVIGDCHARSAGSWVTSEAMRITRSAGYACGLNDPFAGGHIVERHGAPARGIHALQLEIDRRCYLNPSLDALGEGFEGVARLIEALAFGLGELLLGRSTATAAE